MNSQKWIPLSQRKTLYSKPSRPRGDSPNQRSASRVQKNPIDLGSATRVPSWRDAEIVETKGDIADSQVRDELSKIHERQRGGERFPGCGVSEGDSRQSSEGRGKAREKERERHRAFVKIRLKRRPVDWERFRAHRVRLDKFFSLSSAFVLRIRRGGYNEHQRSRQRGRPLISENAIAGTRVDWKHAPTWGEIFSIEHPPLLTTSRQGLHTRWNMRRCMQVRFLGFTMHVAMYVTRWIDRRIDSNAMCAEDF